MSAAVHASLAKRTDTPKTKERAPGSVRETEDLAEEAGVPRFMSGAQTKLEVSSPDDPYEREADAVAQAVQRKAPVRSISPVSGAPRYQRMCKECAEEFEGMMASGALRAPLVQRRALQGTAPASVSGSDVVSALPSPVRGRLEGSLGADLGSVKVHTGPRAESMASGLGAKAFTHGSDIWLGARQSPHDLGLMAHEVTHVLQQGGATGKRAETPARPEPDTVQRKVETPRVGAGGTDSGGQGAAGADAGSAGDGTVSPMPLLKTAAPLIQREEASVLDRAIGWGADRLNDAADAVGEVGQFAGKQLLKLLRSVAPQVADIIDEGPVNYARRVIREALDAHLPAALGGFSLGDMIDAVSGWIGGAVSFAKGLMSGDAKSCSAFASAMETVTGFITGLIDNPIVKAVTGALGKVTDFVGKALKFVAAPVFDAIASQVSSAWSVLKKVSSTVAGWIGKAKSAVGGLWDQLMSALGFDGNSEDGVWAHIKKVGNEIWDSIKSLMAPVLGPLKKVASVVALLTPMGQIHAIVKYGPKLVKVAQWVWNNGLDPGKIREAPEEIRGMLTDLTGGVDGFKGVLQNGLDWLSDKINGLAESVLSVAGAITGLPLIGFARDLFEEARQGLESLVGAVAKGAKSAVAAVESFATKIVAFISPYKEVICSLILAIASPPMIPVVLAGWAWRALPACIKVPIINFILDIAITALEAIPEVPTFNLLWPLLKPGVMAFLRTLRAAEDSVKEQVSNKVAKIISGASPAFLIGFVKGFAVGVWEGISDPFNAIWMVLEGLDAATQYLLSLAGMSDETDEKKPTATEPASAAPATKGAETVAQPAMAPQAASMAAAAPAHPAAIPSASPAAGVSPGSATTTAAGTATGTASGATTAHAMAPAAGTAALHAATPAPTMVPAAPAQATPSQAEAPAARAQASPSPAEPTPASNGGGTSAIPEPADGMAPADMAGLKARASAMAGELSPDVETVKGGFWEAVQEYFNSGTMSFDDLATKFAEAWESAKAKIAEGGSWLAGQLMGFFKGDGAEGELGDKVGWLSGNVAFQALVDFISAGTWAAAGPVLKGIAKFINWPMEALGEAFKLFKTLGKYLLDGLKKLGGAIKDAAAGAFKTVSKALGNIAERLMAFGEEIVAKFGGKAAKAEGKALGVVEKEAAKTVESRAGKQALNEAEEKAAQKLEKQAAKAEPAPHGDAHPEAKKPASEAPHEAKPGGEAPKQGEQIDLDGVQPESAAKREASMAESGHVENDKLTPRQARNESDALREHPQQLEGTAPNRKSKVGEHEWRESTLPNGECQFCRHSPTKVCVATPELRAAELKKTEEHVASLESQAEAHAKAAREAREQALAKNPLSPQEEDIVKKELEEAKGRAKAASKRASTEKGRATDLTKKGKAEEAAAATKRSEAAAAEAKKAKEDIGCAEDMLKEHERALERANQAEAAAKAAKEEATAAANTATKLKNLEGDLAKTEAEIAQLRKEWPATRTMDTGVHRRLRQLEDTAASQRKRLAEGIEASRGLTPEARETLRKGTPFNGAGGAERERAFIEGLPPEAKGPNGTYRDYVTGEPLPLSDLAVDHVVPVNEIFGMKGFGSLPRAEQQAILDMPQNLRFLEKGRNSSKQAASLSKWMNKVPGLDAGAKKTLAELEAQARRDIEKAIEKSLKKVGGGV